jgi:hypothetical protein
VVPRYDVTTTGSRTTSSGGLRDDLAQIERNETI